MAIISVLLISYSYAQNMELIGTGIRTNSEGKYEIYDVKPSQSAAPTMGGAVSWDRCEAAKDTWYENKAKIASIQSKGKEKLNKLKKHILKKYDKKAFRQYYIDNKLKSARERYKTKYLRKKDFIREWRIWKKKRKDKYLSLRKKIIKSAKSEMMKCKKKMLEAKADYARYNCKSRAKRTK